MAEFDLMSRMGPFLDRHFVFPLLEFLSEIKVYEEEDLMRGKLLILENTKMVDFAMETYRLLHKTDDVPEAYKEKRAIVVSQLKKFKDDSEVVFQILSKDDVSRQIQSYRDSRQFCNYLIDKHGFKPEMSDTLFNYAKFEYDCGNYEVAAEYLYFYQLLVSPTDKNYLNGLWGKFASEILMQHWDTALEDLQRLKDYIENNSFGSSLQSLQQRAWLIHWSLFVFFNHQKGRDLIIDMFLGHHLYLNAIQTICPHILRYLATAVITNKARRNVMKDLVKVIQQESYTYRDPITEFIEHLFVNFDFDGAQQKLRQCALVLSSDFFLVACVDEFIENARLMIFETFCRIHQCISINMLAEKLNMEPKNAEHWIVDLIRNAHLNAKIDSKLGHVVMGTQTVSPYQQLIEKTKSLTFRTQTLSENVEKRITTRTSESVGF